MRYVVLMMEIDCFSCRGQYLANLDTKGANTHRERCVEIVIKYEGGT